MSLAILPPLLNNAALLLALVVVYDIATSHYPMGGRPLRQALVGVSVGCVGVAIMLAPLRFEPGIVFDTRSVLLGVSGLFLGAIPTAVAIAMTAALRLYQGGGGAWTGVCVIVASGAIGVAWRHLRGRRLDDIAWRELYCLGLAVHVIMMALMLTLAEGAAWRVLTHVGPPVLLLYPLATAALGIVLAGRLRREHAGAALRDSEDRYRSLFENNHTAMLLIDPASGAIVHANQAACSFYGWTRAQLQEMRITDINVSPPNEVQAEIRRACAGESGRSVVQHRRADGALRDVEVFSGLATIKGKQRLYSVVHDVTDRRRLELALHQSEEEFRVIFETASIGIAQADTRTGQWLRVNGRMCEITGYAADELLELRVPSITYEADRERDWEAFQRVVRGEAPSYRLEKRYVRKDGTLVWVSVNMTVVRDANGQPLRTVATIEDISERRKAEEALEVANARWALVSSSKAVGVMLADAQGGLLEANDYYIDLLGFTRAEFDSGAIRWDERTPAEHLATNRRAIAELREGRACAPYEKEYIRKDGSRVWVLVADALLPGPSERILGIVVDITERKRAEDEARRLLASAEQSRRALLSVVEDQKRTEQARQRMAAQLAQAQKMESVGRLAGGVAHDFNNALGIIIGHAEMALRRIAPGDRFARELAEIRDAALRSASLTRQLLAFARQQTIAPKVLDLNDAVAGTLKMLRRLVGEDIQLAWVPGAMPWPVKMDPTQIDQLLANLVVNARDAIGGVGKITVETQNVVVDDTYRAHVADCAPGDYVRLVVSDDGCGMSKDVREHLFEPFFTTKAVGQGTGLGLATVYGIVQQNNGFINVYSEPGMGATFKLYLPRAAGETSEGQVERAAQVPRGRGETVLLVEDEPAMLEVTGDTLVELGYSVLRAGTPGEALKLAQANAGRIHILITDVVMPEMNGRELARRVSTDGRATRCLFVSGYTADIVAHRGVLEEGVNFLQKPFSQAELAAKVREVLDGEDGLAGGGAA